MTPEQRVELIQAISKQRAFEYVDSLLAAERAATIEECAKACDAQSNYLEHQQHLLATRKCAAAIRKLGEKRGPD